jgi:hypothetical protein
MKVAVPRFELATLLKHYRVSSLTNNTWKLRTLYALARCRTAAMGGHIDRCNHKNCGKLHLSYNSCRNRHCPKCQGHLRERWIQAREADLIKVPYFHVVFTLPDCLNELALMYPKQLYDALFKASWSVVKDFGSNPTMLGAKTGMIALLHTWAQNLSLHPHLHCIVPAGGVTRSGKWKPTRSKGRFLFPVKAMSRVFRARFTEQLTKRIDLPYTIRKQMFAKRWMVYAKRPFFGPKQVIEYLGRYSHKIAISTHRIKDIDDGKVYFTAKDYRHSGKKLTLVLEAREFIRRFAMHILPKGFTRIRHYGILSSSKKGVTKGLVDSQLGPVRISRPNPVLNRTCPSCRKGELQTVAVFDQRGPPKHWIKRLTSSKIN